MRFGAVVRLIFGVSCLAQVSFGQWIQESIQLKLGWNSVSFNTQPEPSNCDLLFSNLPVVAVHKWNRSLGGIEFNNDPSNTVSVPPNWLVWRPASHPQAFLNDYSALEAGESYLIEMSNSAVLSFAGRAQIMNPTWLPNEFNLVGLPVSSANPPTFSEFFRYSSEIKSTLPDAEFYRILTNGTEQKIFQPALTDTKRGEAYWVKAGQVQNYAGPLWISINDASKWINYGLAAYPKILKIQNVATSGTHTVVINTLTSGPPPQINGTNLFPALEGPVPLSYEVTDWQTLQSSYQNLPSVITTNLAPGAYLELKLLPRVLEMTGGDSNSVWESIIQVLDSSGEVEQKIGVAARGGADLATDPSGLWVGDVRVTDVSRMHVGGTVSWDSTEPVPASDVFSFRVLLHVNANREVKLLQRALVAWNPTAQIIATAAGTYTNGEFSIFTDEEDAEAFAATNAKASISRISSVLFPYMDPVPMSGQWATSNGLSCAVTMSYTNPVNPFFHRYAPLHDNLEYNNDVPAPLAEGFESFTFQRYLSFSFADQDPVFGSGNPLWGVSQLGGTFLESVAGLNDSINSTNRIHVKGSFRIQKVNETDHLE